MMIMMIDDKDRTMTVGGDDRCQVIEATKLDDNNDHGAQVKGPITISSFWSFSIIMTSSHDRFEDDDDDVE